MHIAQSGVKIFFFKLTSTKKHHRRSSTQKSAANVSTNLMKAVNVMRNADLVVSISAVPAQTTNVRELSRHTDRKAEPEFVNV
jgi:hypothetical protein